MNPIKEIIEAQKENTKEYSELFLLAQNAIVKKFKEISPVVELEFMDGYFIFYHGEYSVANFKLSKYPEWQFGVWLSYNEDEERPHRDYIRADVFCQVERFIDKFKPSRSEFKADIRFYKKFDEEGEDLDEFDFEISDWDMNPFKLIWTKPYLAIHRGISSIDYNEEFVRPIKAFFSVRKAFLEDSLEERKKARADKYFTHKLTKWFNSQKVFFANAEFEIYDSGENVSPRFHPKLTIEQGFEQEDIEFFEDLYRNYKDEIGKKKFGEDAWLYDNFGWIYWYEFTDSEGE